jgi:hypothetical protein
MEKGVEVMDYKAFRLFRLGVEVMDYKAFRLFWLEDGHLIDWGGSQNAAQLVAQAERSRYFCVITDFDGVVVGEVEGRGHAN